MISAYQRLLQSALMRVRPNVLAAKLKRLLRVRRVVQETPQGRFFIDPVSLLGVALSRHGIHEPGMVSTLEQCLQSGGSFVDLGANEGYFSVIAARLCGPEGRVVAIEPQHRLLPVIAENLRLNEVTNASLVNAAITDHPGKATLHLAADTNSGSSGLSRNTKYELPTQEVAALTLEQVLDAQGLAVVDLMKVDIEGFEYEALLGSPRVFEEHRIKAIALELHPSILAARGKDARDVEALLSRCGYAKVEMFENTVWRV